MMSADRLSRELNNDRPAARIRLWRCLLAIPAALLSTLSVSVFRYMRAFEGIGQYYSGEMQGLLRDSLSPRNLIPALLFLLFYAVCFHSPGRVRPASVLTALLPSFFAVSALSLEHSDPQTPFLPIGPVGNIAVLLGFVLPICFCIELIYLLCDRKTRYRIWADELNFEADTHLFLGAFACILLLWLPILFLCYPGSVHGDTRVQIMSWLGLKPVTTAYPVFTTAVYGLLYRAGMAMGGQEKALFLNLLTQTVFVSAVMGLTAAYICRYTRSKRWFWFTVAFFGVLPLWQSAVQVTLHDVAHTACFLLFTCVYLECLRKREKSWRNALLLLLTAILMAATRRQSFYIAAVCILVAALCHWRRFLLPYLAMLAVFIGLFWLGGSVLCPRLDIRESETPDAFRLRVKEAALYRDAFKDEMSAGDIAVIDAAMAWEETVRGETPAPDGEAEAAPAGAEPSESLRQLYRQMLRRHPVWFAKRAFLNAFEYLNPWFGGTDFYSSIDRREDFLTADYKSDVHAKLVGLWNGCLKVPVLRLLIGAGLYAWLLLIVLGYSARRRSGLALLGLFPSLGQLACLLMSPVNGEIRYAYPLIAAAPLCFAWVLFAISRKSPENPRLSGFRFAREEDGFGLFRRDSRAEPEPGKSPAEQPDEDPPEVTVIPGKTGPVLDFVMRYIPVPGRPKTYLDVLKVLAIFLVLWNHTSHGFGLYADVLDMPQHLLYLCASIFDKIAVPLFFMASGALLLGREESWGQLLRHRVRRFALILLTVSVISYVYYYRGFSSYSFVDFLGRLYSGRILTPLWYLYSYLAMLLMLPFLRKLARCMKETDYLWLLGLYSLSQLLSVTDFFWFKGTLHHSSDFFLFTSWSYVLFALFGFYIERVMPKSRLNMENLSLLLMLSVLGIGASYLLTEHRMQELGKWTTDNSQTFFNTFIAFPSITVFFTAKLWFTRHPVSGRAAAVWSLLATGTFGAYLFERYWRDTAWPVYETSSRYFSSFTSSLLHVLAAGLLGILATLLYKLLTGLLKALFRGRDARRAERLEKTPLAYTVPSEDISDLEEIESLLVSRHRKSNSP
jgi:Uncharacterized protein conserved in bacteria